MERKRQRQTFHPFVGFLGLTEAPGTPEAAPMSVDEASGAGAEVVEPDPMSVDGTPKTKPAVQVVLDDGDPATEVEAQPAAAEGPKRG